MFVTRSPMSSGVKLDIWAAENGHTVDPKVYEINWGSTSMGKEVTFLQSSPKIITHASFNIGIDVPDRSILEVIIWNWTYYCPPAVYLMYTPDGMLLCKPGCMPWEPIKDTVKRLERFLARKDGDRLFLTREFNCANTTGTYRTVLEWWIKKLTKANDYEWSWPETKVEAVELVSVS